MKAQWLSGWALLLGAVAQVALAALSYPEGFGSTVVYTVNQDIYPNQPTLTDGIATAWSVTPDLPQGLVLDGQGVISGTPLKVLAETFYTVQATGRGIGFVEATIGIQINDVPPSDLRYAVEDAVYQQGVYYSNKPSSQGGEITSYILDPGASLPRGLRLNPRTGELSGTITNLMPRTLFTVTGSNSGGSTDAAVYITVNAEAPNKLRYPSMPQLTKTREISPITPTYTGMPVSWESVPPLPGGLVLNSRTGVVSGTPKTVGKSTHTVTARNTGGVTSTLLVLDIFDIPPTSLKYQQPAALYTLRQTIAPNRPGNEGGAATSYSISPTSLPPGLSFEPSTGEVTGTPIELSPQRSFVVTASNTGGDASASITIRVVDVRPSAFTYSSTSPAYSVGEAIAPNTPVSLPGESGGGVVVSYGLAQGSMQLPPGLSLDEKTGVISGTPTERGQWLVTVEASNSGGENTADVQVTVRDAAPPAMRYDTVPIAGLELHVGKAISVAGPTLTATGQPPPSSVTFSLAEGQALPSGLVIDAMDGSLSGAASATSDAQTYTVQATNAGGSTVVLLRLMVLEAVPSELSYTNPRALYTLNSPITPNVAAVAPAGVLLTSFAISPSLQSALPGLRFDANTGEISGTPALLTDDYVKFTVQGSNSGGTVQTMVEIRIVASLPASIAYSERNAVYTVDVPIAVNKPSFPAGSITSFAIIPTTLPNGLSFDASTGAITGTPTVPFEAALFRVSGSSQLGDVATTLTIAVNDRKPADLSYTLTTALYPRATSITPNIPSVSGGAVTQWTVAPSLPAGLAIDAKTGAITGTPLAASEAAIFVVSAKNSGGQASTSLSIAISLLPPANFQYAVASAQYTRGTRIPANGPSYSLELGDMPESYTVAPPLPVGLSLNPLSGVIAGTPSRASAATAYLVVATNSGGSSNVTLSIIVRDVPPGDLSYESFSNTYYAGEPIARNGPTTGGEGVELWTVSPPLPPGLSLNAGSGVLSGTPLEESAKTFYTIKGSNSAGVSEISITIAVVASPPRSLTYATSSAKYQLRQQVPLNIPSVTVLGLSYDMQLNPIEGLSFSALPSLPVGLVLNASTGFISGSPLVVSPASVFKITVSNSGGKTQADLVLTVTQEAPRNLTYAFFDSVYQTGKEIQNNAPASLGGDITQYSIDKPLPNGLSLNTATGEISGSPTEALDRTEFFLVGRNEGGEATTTLFVTVLVAAPRDLAYTAPDATYTVGRSIQVNVPTFTGGAPSSFAISPTVPAGLVFDAVSGMLTGTPSSPQPRGVYLVTAANSGGTATADLAIAVNDHPPTNLTYPSMQLGGGGGGERAVLRLLQNTPFAPLQPSNEGGKIERFQISRPLPFGLTFSFSTGIIGGTAKQTSSLITYFITGSNAEGSTSFPFNLMVLPQPPQNLSYPALPFDPSVPGGGAWRATFTVNVPLPSAAEGVSPVLDAGQASSFSLSPAIATLVPGLRFDGLTGRLAGTPSFLVPEGVVLQATAENAGGSTSCQLVLFVVDLPPLFRYPQTSLALSIDKAVPAGLKPASEPGGGQVVQYGVSPQLPTGMSLDEQTGLLGGVARELVAESTFQITGTNSGGSHFVNMTISVADMPPFNITFPAWPSSFVRNTLIQPLLPSALGGAVTSWSVAPPLPIGLSLNAATGAVTGTPVKLQPELTSHMITASNSGGQAVVVVQCRVVARHPGAIFYAENPWVLTLGQPIVPAFPSVSTLDDLSAVFTVNPPLPAGLTLNAVTGAIAGAPQLVSSSYSRHVVQVSNSGGQASVDVQIKINDRAPTNLRYSTNATDALLHALRVVPLGPWLPLLDGGKATSFSVSPPLPQGLLLDATTGAISGAALAESAPSRHTVTASNSGGATSVQVQVRVLDVPPANVFLAVSSANRKYTLGQFYDDSQFRSLLIDPTDLSSVTGATLALGFLPPSATGGRVAFWDISPPLPKGLALRPSDGSIFGVPTLQAASAAYTITAFNSGGNATATLMLAVVASPPQSLEYFGSELLEQLKPTEPNTPLYVGGAVDAFSVLPPLPAGLVLNNRTGVISGTPSEVSSKPTTHIVTAANTGGQASATVRYFIKPPLPPKIFYQRGDPPLSIGPSSLLSLVLGSPIPPLRLGTTGGGVELVVVAPALPVGLSLDNRTGLIDGIPSVLAPLATYRVTGSNTGGSSSLNLNIEVLAARPALLGYDAPASTYTVGVPIPPNSPREGQGGGAVDRYSVTVGTLPRGLLLDNATGTVSGIPEEVAAASTYTVSAVNTGGEVHLELTIEVQQVPPGNLSYPSISPLAAGQWPQAILYRRLPADATLLTPLCQGGGPEDGFRINPPLPFGLYLNASSGAVMGTPVVMAPATDYTVSCFNTGGEATSLLRLTVLDLPPTGLAYAAATTTLVLGQPAVANRLTLDLAQGGEPTGFTVEPLLPEGLELTTTGTIKGTPLQLIESTVFTVSALNSGGSASIQVRLSVVDIPPSLLMYFQRAPVYTQGTPIPANKPTNLGGTITQYRSSPPLNEIGLSLNPSTGVITGTPWRALQQPYTITGSNSGGNVTAQLIMTVNAAPITSLRYSTPSATYILDRPISPNAPVYEGGQAVLFSTDNQGRLPRGLSLAVETGVISGTPTELTLEGQPLSVNIVAINSGGGTATTVQISVVAPQPALLRYDSSIATYTVGQAIQRNEAANMGGGITRFSVSPPLPAGLFLDPVSGGISGLPVVVSPASAYTITGSNSGGQAQMAVVIGVVDRPPGTLQYDRYSLRCSRFAAIEPDRVQHDGGKVTTWTIHPALPLGLDFNRQDGSVSGAPQEAWPRTAHVVTATNTGGAAQAQLFVEADFGLLRFGVKSGDANKVLVLQRFFDSLSPPLPTVVLPLPDNLDAGEAVQARRVDVVMAGALSAFIGWKRYGLRVEAAAWQGPGVGSSASTFKPVAVVRRGGGVAQGAAAQLTDLLGKRACLGPLGEAESYAPVMWAVQEGRQRLWQANLLSARQSTLRGGGSDAFQNEYSQADATEGTEEGLNVTGTGTVFACDSPLRVALASMFGPSCAPPAVEGLPGLCDACLLDRHIDTGSSSSCTSSHRFGGSAGALDGLLEGACDVAFVRASTVEELCNRAGLGGGGGKEEGEGAEAASSGLPAVCRQADRLVTLSAELGEVPADGLVAKADMPADVRAALASAVGVMNGEPDVLRMLKAHQGLGLTNSQDHLALFGARAMQMPGVAETVQCRPAVGPLCPPLMPPMPASYRGCPNWPVLGATANSPIRMPMPPHLTAAQENEFQNYFATVAAVSDLHVRAVPASLASVDALGRAQADIIDIESGPALLSALRTGHVVLAADSSTSSFKQADSGAVRNQPVAWVRKHSDISSFQGTLGRRVCHGGMLSLAGMLLPLGWAQQQGFADFSSVAHLERSPRCSFAGVATTARRLFGASCAPSNGAGGPMQGVCDLCPSSAACDHNNAYAGATGALQGLSEGACEVAFFPANTWSMACDPAQLALKNQGVPEWCLKAENFRQVWEAPEEWATSRLAHRVIMARRNAFSPDVAQRLLKMLQAFNYQPELLHLMRKTGLAQMEQAGTTQGTENHFRSLAALLRDLKVPGVQTLLGCSNKEVRNGKGSEGALCSLLLGARPSAGEVEGMECELYKGGKMDTWSVVQVEGLVSAAGSIARGGAGSLLGMISISWGMLLILRSVSYEC